MKFPELGKPETIERRYLGKLPRKAIGLVKGLLKMDPAERLTVRDALRHNYFEDLPNVQEYLK
jgi:cyclin-dependent kinase-like